jgi:catechol 2,3-dioxygenase-like lactoylglutathione lyase family enzyme
MAHLFAVTIDCTDPWRLAAFYRAFLGGELYWTNDDFVALAGESPVRLDFQRVSNDPPPAWPDPAAPRRVHLDFEVDDLERATEDVLALGAVLADSQPGGRRFRVLLDPEGHPFCLATPEAATLRER